ncbi:DNA-directed RNA polymerase subunit beta' [Astathelohania contejeani]|uniref:DNA-directed RNA polymerase subunit beta n=1 Tax=Astathelohania contejeani TaxID=164912 RepID=A0ABQ7HVH8_9MICR|nr:DNA-directed RNA polymerase subunit beta' [Thelohania contejeani]
MKYYKWLMPERLSRNVSLNIEKAFMGTRVPHLEQTQAQQELQHAYYTVKPLTISLETYNDIVANICNITFNKSHLTNVEEDEEEVKKRLYKYLHLSKLTNQLVKSDLKYFIAFSQGICPSCNFVNCIICANQNQFKRYMSNYKVLTKNLIDSYPRFIKCHQCQKIFKTHKEILSSIYPLKDNNINIITTGTAGNVSSKNKNHPQTLFNIIFRYIKERHRIFRPAIGGWQCKTCQSKYEESYAEFRIYLNRTYENNISPKTVNNSNHNKFLFRTPMKLYQRLKSQSQGELRNDPIQLTYSLNVKLPNGNNCLIPPVSFLMDHQRSLSFYKKLITDSSINMNKVKTSYGSVLSRMTRGKFSSIRQHGHNKRYIGSARVVITPCNELEPDECILPVIVWRRLDCPRYILAHRYPTLDDRNFTLHRVIACWIYPVMAIPTSIVHGNHADFDGDAMQVIPVSNNVASEAEAITLFHPRTNLVLPGSLRLAFDHDEILMLYYLYGLNRSEIHGALYDLAINESSTRAYDIFLRLRRLCHDVIQTQMVFSISYQDLLQFIHQPSPSYVDFIEKIFPNVSKNNTIKCMILAESSRFSIDHLWQIVGEINERAHQSFLEGMNRRAFISMARLSRDASNKDIALYGYTYIKLLYCTCLLVCGYDGRIYTPRGILAADRLEDIL